MDTMPYHDLSELCVFCAEAELQQSHMEDILDCCNLCMAGGTLVTSPVLYSFMLSQMSMLMVNTVMQMSA